MLLICLWFKFLQTIFLSFWLANVYEMFPKYPNLLANVYEMFPKYPNLLANAYEMFSKYHNLN